MATIIATEKFCVSRDFFFNSSLQFGMLCKHLFYGLSNLMHHKYMYADSSIYLSIYPAIVWSSFNHNHQICKRSIKIEIYYASNVIHMLLYAYKIVWHMLHAYSMAVHVTSEKKGKAANMSLTVIIEWIISPIQPSLLSFQINSMYLHQPFTKRLLSIQFQCDVHLWCT